LIEFIFNLVPLLDLNHFWLFWVVRMEASCFLFLWVWDCFPLKRIGHFFSACLQVVKMKMY